MGTKIGTQGFSPSKIFKYIFEDKIDEGIYWEVLAQIGFLISEQDCCLFCLKPKVTV